MRCPHCEESWGWLSTYRFPYQFPVDARGESVVKPQLWAVWSTPLSGVGDDAWSVRYWRGSAAHALQICMHCWEAVS